MGWESMVGTPVLLLGMRRVSAILRRRQGGDLRKRGFSKIYSVTGSLCCSDGTTSTANSTGYSRPAYFSTVLSVSVPNLHRAARRDLRFFLIRRSALASRSNRSKRLSCGRPCLTECRWIDQTERGKYSWTVYQDANATARQVILFGQLGIGDPRVN